MQADVNDTKYKKHGFIAKKATESGNTGKAHNNENIKIPGFTGTINVLGGGWENAVYKVTIS